MKNNFLFIVFLFPISCLAQTLTDSTKNISSSGMLSLGVSLSNHGTGDLNGYLIDVAYEYQLKKRFSFFNNLAFSVNSGQDGGYNLIDQPNEEYNQSKPLIFVKSGIQTTPTLFYALVNRENQKFKIGVGPVFRYQENSLPNLYSYTKANSSVPQNYYVIKEVQPRVFTVGYKFSFDYLFLNKPKSTYNLKAFYQNDTNGDVIVGIGLSYSHKIKFL